MNRNRARALGRLIGLILVTLFAGAVMWATGVRRVDRVSQLDELTDTVATPALIPAAPVAVETLLATQVEVLHTYAGMIQPFERYSVAFEVPGRVAKLGKDDQQQDLDEGARLQKGQVLATLDTRILVARVNETAARLEQAQQELERAQQMRRAPNPAISETEYQTRVTELAIAEAQVTTAQKNLEDATLTSPCNGILSKRMINAGESIGMHQPAFEIVEVDRVLLVVGVPESRVQELARRRQQLIDACQDGRRSLPFRVHVQLMGQDRFGRPWSPREGEVYRIGETADDKTGLFEVEVLLDNSNGQLKPGLVAQAKIVIDELVAFRIPVNVVLFRGVTPYFYAIQEQPTELQSLFWNLGPQPDFYVKQVALAEYIEQEGELIVPQIDAEHRRIVVRGQHRLVDGRRVRIVNADHPSKPAVSQAPPAVRNLQR